MSKRVANKKGKWAGARSGRIRIGWKRMRKIEALKHHQKQLNLQDISDDIKTAMKSVGKLLRSVMPKKNKLSSKALRRHQGR